MAFFRLFSFKDVGLICLKIALIVTVTEGLIMTILPYVSDHLSVFWEGFLDTLSLVTVITPVTAFYIIRPYVEQRNRAQEQFDLVHKENEAILENQKNALAEAVKEATKKVKESEERYQFALQASNDGLWDWDLKHKIIYFASRFKEILGLKDSEMHNDVDEWFGRVDPEDLPGLKAEIHKSKNKEAQNQQPFEYEYRMVHASRQPVWILSRWIVIFDDKGEAIRLVGSHSNVTKRKNVEVQLTHDAYHDALTGLPNRVLFNDRLEQLLLLSKRDNALKFAVIFVDLDNFKEVNDNLGHHAGDDLLIKFAKGLKSQLRLSDTVARLGGDEFAIILQQVDSAEDIKELINHLFSQMSRHLISGNLKIQCSMSMGIVQPHDRNHYQNAADILRDADIALYRAKSSGKSQYVFFDESMREAVNFKFEVTNNLIGAVGREEISLFYQPIVSLKTQEIVGFEALMRWQHPTLGFVPPLHFIPIAEESAVINELGNYALITAANQLKTWRGSIKGGDNWFMNVNVSGKQLENDSILATLEKVLKMADFPPEKLKIEITESILINYRDNLERRLERIRAMGIGVAIDDFGTGYSSLNLLNQFDFNTLKIDRSFVEDIDHNVRSQHMVEMIQLLSKALKLNTVVEGIETMRQLKQVANFGCDYGQGYIFSKGLTAHDMEIALKQGLSPLNWKKTDKILKSA